MLNGLRRLQGENITANGSLEPKILESDVRDFCYWCPSQVIRALSSSCTGRYQGASLRQERHPSVWLSLRLPAQGIQAMEIRWKVTSLGARYHQLA